MQTNLSKSHLESKLPNCTFIWEYYTKISHYEVTFWLGMFVHTLISFLPLKEGFLHDSNHSFSSSQNNLVYLNSTLVKEQWKLWRKDSGFCSLALCLIAEIAFALKGLCLAIIYPSSGEGPEGKGH